MDGDVDIAAVAALVGEPARARMLLALADGRALPSSVLAQEAGVATSTASEHLARLLQARLLAVESWGRHRYYRLSGPEVASAVEALARLAPIVPVRSLRGSDRLRALRQARSCYDHLAGRLGVALMEALLRDGILDGGDGCFHREAAHLDRLCALGRDNDYRITIHGAVRLRAFGIDLRPAGRPLTVRYCVDWSEQRHHLAGGLGAALLARLLELDWIRRAPKGRALTVTPAGTAGLHEVFGILATRWHGGRAEPGPVARPAVD